MKDQIDKSFIELKKILDKYSNTFKADKNKILGRKTSLALSSTNMSLRKYNKKYQEIIGPFKGSIFDKMNTDEPSNLIEPLGEYLKKLKKQKLSRNCLNYYEIHNLFLEIFRNTFGIEIENSVEEFYIYLRKNQHITVGKKRIYNDKNPSESKRLFYRNLLNKFISSIYYYIPNDFIEGLVGYIETFCWNSNNSKLNDDYINIIEKVVNEIMKNNKERNEWNIIKKGRCNGEITTVYTLI